MKAGQAHPDQMDFPARKHDSFPDANASSRTDNCFSNPNIYTADRSLRFRANFYRQCVSYAAPRKLQWKSLLSPDSCNGLGLILVELGVVAVRSETNKDKQRCKPETSLCVNNPISVLYNNYIILIYLCSKPR